MRRQAAFSAAAGALALAAAACPGRPASAAVPSTTTVALSAVQSAYGQPVTASAAVTTAAGPGEGDVVFSVDGVAFKAGLGADGTASIVLPRAGAGAHAVQATYLPRDPLLQDGSTSSSAGWQVAQVRTRLQVDVTGRRLRAPMVVHVRAAGEYGTTASGDVRIVVRRWGRKVRVAGGALESGALTSPVRLATGPSRRGGYRVAVTYRGDAQHLPATRTVHFRIGPRR
ncbi:hypothetical protein ASC64_10155 [Nocardioides sp. Root122]|nr:hypothetical protein ASC64_10155 [Nocardioides sp. Root122]